MINWQLSKQGIRWPVSPDRSTGSSVDSSRSSIFLKLSADKLSVSNDHRLKFIFSRIHIKYVGLCHYGPELLGFWFQTDLGSENSSSFFKSTGGEDLILPWSRVGHALRPIFILWLVKIWQVSSCGNIMQHLESCLLWQVKLTEFCVNLWCFYLSFSSGCTKWNTAAIKSLLLFMAGLFTGFLVEKCVACQNSVIRFRMASFSFFTFV